uniref:Membrane transporter protein n=1 Tax=viral metagenome TaxID=1070528 RepID=A0A6C0AWU7_9ZZZZ|tara:strand:- start:5152 stop:5550 length:399 start_codon:yes stop_codon:yes gene_type:complete
MKLIKNFIYLFIGCIAGVSMGAIGIGAGLITMPLLIYSGLTISESVAVAMVMQLLPQSLPGVYNYWKYIKWEPTVFVILGSFFGIWFGSMLSANNYLSELFLYRFLAIFLLLSSFYFFIKHWNPVKKINIIE